MAEQTATDIKTDKRIEDMLGVLRNNIQTIHSAGYYKGYADAEKVSLARITELEGKLAAAEEVIDVILFCPECRTQHIDANPSCQCGHLWPSHRDKEYDADVAGSMPGQGSCTEEGCKCTKYHLWVKRPHWKHLCHNCSHVWKAANRPTNGVENLEKTNDQH